MTNLVYKMEESTRKDVSVFQKFILENKYMNKTLFFFVEGNDFCYYYPRIKENSFYDSFKCYKCEGKKNVIGVRNLISKTHHEKKSNTLLYFVDRDYGFESVPDDIYVTDFYSIENFYLNEKMIESVLENFMELEVGSNNFNLAIEYYNRCYKVYSKFAMKINAFYYTIRFYEKKYNYRRTDLNSIRFSNFITNNSIDNFSMDIPEFNKLKTLYSVEHDIEEVDYNNNIRLFNEDNHYNFRGKFELEFLKWFLFSIKKEIRDGNLSFDKQIVCSYDFCMDIMRMLSIYAYTPKALIEYISLHNKEN